MDAWTENAGINSQSREIRQGMKAEEARREQLEAGIIGLSAKSKGDLQKQPNGRARQSVEEC